MSKDYQVNVIPPDPVPLRVNISVQLYEVIAVNEPKQVKDDYIDAIDAIDNEKVKI